MPALNVENTKYYTSTAVVVSLKATKLSFLALNKLLKRNLIVSRTGPQTKDGGLNSAQNFILKVNMATRSFELVFGQPKTQTTNINPFNAMNVS